MKMSKINKGIAWLCALALTAGSVGSVPVSVLADNTSEPGGPSQQLTDEDINHLYTDASTQWTSVHDPSIVSDGNGTYYIFGSHMGVSKTTDLQNWTGVYNETLDSGLYGKTGEDGTVTKVSYTEAFTSNAYTGTVTLADGTEVPFGTNYNMNDWISGIDQTDEGPKSHTIQGNMWAPDVIYNETMGKWCMYQSLNGNHWTSGVVLLTADDIEGPYVYQGPVVFTGFDSTIPDFYVENENRSFHDTDIELVLGEMETLPDRYVTGNHWGTYWPHAIDPCVSYDEEGNLWMIYGSWSGGIYALELDENTGLRDYTVTYASDYDENGASVTTDPYFGKKLAGGYYVSGEGPYIEKIGDYWYLFMSYGFYSPEGGYEMRVFRSENIDGPYIDTKGESAIYSRYLLNFGANAATQRGMKVMGNYQWDTMSVAEIAQGHNSAYVDEDGKAYVVYHTKFDDGTAGHQVRVHQLFLNEDGWFVTAPYQYSGETVDDTVIRTTPFAAETIAGDYQLILHKYNVKCIDQNGETEVIRPVDITLEADGTVTGAAAGTWAETEGTAYITLTLDGKTYKGVLVEQTIDGSTVKTLCFTALCQETGVNIWGSKVLSDDVVVAKNVKYNAPSIPERTFTSFPISSNALDGASITWVSSNPDVLASDGTVTKPAEDTVVTLTQTVSKGDYYYTKSYDVTVLAATQTQEESYTIGTYYPEGIDISTGIDASISIVNPFYKYGTYGLDLSGGATIEFDVVKTGDLHVLGTIFSFMADQGNGGRLYFTPGSYLGYNATGGFFDANIKDFGLVQDYIGESAHVAVSLTDEGFTVTVNGEVAYTEEILTTENGGGSLTNYANMINWLQNSADRIFFGYGSWWNAAGFDEANCTISNVTFTAAPLDPAPDYFQMDHASLTSSDYIDYYNNPLYGKEINELYVEYTINWDEEAAMNGWDAVFSFFNSKNNGRVSFQTSPYLCFNGAGKWMDIKNDALIGELNKGQDYTFTWIVTPDKAEVYLDGVKLVTAETASGDDVIYSDILNFVSTCDQFTIGVGQGTTAFWWTEICELSDLYFSSHLPDITPYTKDQVSLTTNGDITYEDNPLYGRDLDGLLVEYTINWKEASAQNGWDGIFSFWDGNGGRVSFQTAPYICWNGGGHWMDINQGATLAATLEKERDYTFTIYITENDLKMYVDGTPITGFTVNKSDDGATYGAMLDFIASCPQITWGVGIAATAFWNTEICDLSDITFAPAYLDAEAENGLVTGIDHTSLTNTLTAEELTTSRFVGWYNGTTLLSTNPTETFTVCSPVTLTALFEDVDKTLRDPALAASPQTVTVGDTVNLTASVTGGLGELHYSYYYTLNEEETPVAAAEDITESSISFVTTEEGTLNFYVVITDGVATVTSEPVAVTVRLPRTVEELKENLVYGNDFESGAADAAVVGSGIFEYEEGAYGHIFQNAAAGQASRSNYLVLPSDIMTQVVESQNRQMSIGFWVNVGDATEYFYTPLFTMYGAAPTEDGNTWPMFALQSRLLAQVNCGGYTDMTAAENAAGVNKEDTSWLDDGEWHYYTATITDTSVKIYVDGILQNEWVLSNADGNKISGLFDETGKELTYICLGGNQAWNWADADPAYEFDDVAIYSIELRAAEIQAIMEDKPNHENCHTPGPSATTTEDQVCVVCGEVLVEAHFPFTDVAQDDWYYDYVVEAFDARLMNGVTDELFLPVNSMTRGMAVTVLYRMYGSPEIQAENQFADVEEGSWYYEAVQWASVNGIVNGYEGFFYPDQLVTREEMVVMFYRYAAFCGADTSVTADLSVFEDADQVSDWADAAVQWAVGSGILCGTPEGRLNPGGTATRAESTKVLVLTYELLNQ